MIRPICVLPLFVLPALVACGKIDLDAIVSGSTDASTYTPENTTSPPADAQTDAPTNPPNDASAEASAEVGTNLLDGLLAHYTFDQGVWDGGTTDSGLIVPDVSPNNHFGYLTGSTYSFLPDGGAFGGALHLGGTDGTGMDYVWVEHFPAPTMMSGFSVSVWVRTLSEPDPNSFQPILSTEDVFTSGWELNLLNSNSEVQFAYWDPYPPDETDAGNDADVDAGGGGTDANLDAGEDARGYVKAACPAACIPPNAWTHFVAVVNGNEHTMTLYVDGNTPGPQPAPDFITPSMLQPLLMGTWAGALPSNAKLTPRWLIGDIDDVAIYGRVLSPAEVMQLQTHSPPD